MGDPKTPTNVKEIIVIWLSAHGYDGLCNPDDDCGCGLDDFIPCSGEFEFDKCQPAYKRILKKTDEEYAQLHGEWGLEEGCEWYSKTRNEEGKR